MYGPIVGALIVKTASEALSQIYTRWLLVLGMTFILCVLYMRGGIWGLAQSLFKKHKRAEPSK